MCNEVLFIFEAERSQQLQNLQKHKPFLLLFRGRLQQTLLFLNKPSSWSRYWTGTSVQWRLMRRNIIKEVYVICIWKDSPQFQSRIQIRPICKQSIPVFECLFLKNLLSFLTLFFLASVCSRWVWHFSALAESPKHPTSENSRTYFPSVSSHTFRTSQELGISFKSSFFNCLRGVLTELSKEKLHPRRR